MPNVPKEFADGPISIGSFKKKGKVVSAQPMI
jgi:hypothetical protein